MVKNLHNRRWTLVLSILSCSLFLLSACGKDTELVYKDTDLVCERCGAIYTAHGDYSDIAKEDRELTELYGIDYIKFYCEDCFNEVFHGQAVYSAYVTSLVNTEDLQIIQEYQAEQSAKKKSMQTRKGNFQAN